MDEDYAVRTEELGAKAERLARLLAEERVRSALLSAGVDPRKAERAARLIDAGALPEDEAELKEALAREVTKLLEDFPELLKAGAEPRKGGFKIGSDGKGKEPSEDLIMSLFGNK
ncbi:MAG: hypothetical protein LBK41_08305 [Clostridiales bacterium]|jgi:hypothetical protein|nr:hypothetical protein [Clostridiales bacterium]